MSKKVFISYSHKDKEFVEELSFYLRQLSTEFQLESWDDTRIRPGHNWKDELKSSLLDSDAAILLISPDYLASDYISKYELPKILASAENHGTVVMPVIVSSSLLDESSLGRFQAFNNPNDPLDLKPKEKRNQTWLELSYAVRRAIRISNMAENAEETTIQHQSGENENSLVMSIDPGTATPEEIGELLAEISEFYRLIGGAGLVFSFSEVNQHEVA